MRWALALLLLGQNQIRLQDENVPQGNISTLNCTGDGVRCTQTGPPGAGIGTISVNAVTIDGGRYASADDSFITQKPSSNLTKEQALSLLASGLLYNTTATGVLSIYPGTSCSGNFPRSISTLGAATCDSVALATSDVSGTLPEIRGGTGAGALTCNSNQRLTSNGTLYSCSNTTGPVETTVALTTLGSYFTTTVTGQAWVSTSSIITCDVLGTTADSLTPETIALGQLTVTVSNRVAATGFDVTVFSPNGLEGTVRVHCNGI